MHGNHKIPVRLELEGVVLTFTRDGNTVFYTREQGEEKIERILLTSYNTIVLNPIEPVHLPKKISTNLLIELATPIVVAPRTTEKIFITFPVETGVFICNDDEQVYELLDVFSLEKPKFTLYGEVKSGFVCKYWKSTVSSSLPSVKSLHEGCIELKITNKTPRWFQVTKTVFSAYGMKIYFDKNAVGMRGTMKITGEGNAETDFFDKPLTKGMTKAHEMYTAKMLPGLVSKFVMEGGL